MWRLSYDSHDGVRVDIGSTPARTSDAVTYSYSVHDSRIPSRLPGDPAGSRTITLVDSLSHRVSYTALAPDTVR